MEEHKYWLAFSSINGIGTTTINKLWNHFGCIKDAWFSSAADLHQIDGINSSIIETILYAKNNLSPDKLLESILKNDIELIAINEDSYPEELKKIYNPPVLIYAKGNIDILSNTKKVGIVGTRKPTTMGREASYQISRDLSKQNITIVSGLAAGVDTCAHIACLEVSGETIAVLGSGHNKLYPKSNVSLVDQMIKTGYGLIISEYPPDFDATSWTFPQRNRIISGLSQSIIVIESKEKGGGLITARIATEQAKEVFGVPSKITNEGNKGVHQLIKKGQARIFISTEKFLKHMGWEQLEVNNIKKPELTKVDNAQIDKIPSERVPIEKKRSIEENLQEELVSTERTTEYSQLDFNPKEIQVLEIIKEKVNNFDSIHQKTNLNVPELLGILTILEMKGVIKQLAGKSYQLL